MSSSESKMAVGVSVRPLLLIFAFLFLLNGCGSDMGDSSNAPPGQPGQSDKPDSAGYAADLLAPGNLTVGTDAPFPPFESGKAPNLEGFDIDVVKEIARELGLKAEIRDSSVDTIFPDLADGKFDMVAAALAITPERQREVNFSDPYYDVAQTLVVPTGSGIRSVEDLAGKRVGALDGSDGILTARKQTDAGSVVGYPSTPAAVAALGDGKIDAIVVDQAAAREVVGAGRSGLDVAAVIPTGEVYGLAFSESSPALLAAVNEALTTLKQNGGLNRIYRKWFDVDAPETVINGRTVTVE